MFPLELPKPQARINCALIPISTALLPLAISALYSRSVPYSWRRSHPQRDRAPRHPPYQARSHHRPFCTNSRQAFTLPSNVVSSFLSSFSSSEPITINTSRSVPFSRDPLFRIISSIDTYPNFLPFVTSATIDSYDPENPRFPRLATLAVGYQGMTESFTSLVRCSPDAGTVEAFSGPAGALQYAREENKKAEELIKHLEESAGQQEQDPDWVLMRERAASITDFTHDLVARDSPTWQSVSEKSPFEYLHTKWQLTELPGQKVQTRANFGLKVEFKNPVYTQLLRATEGKIAEKIIEGFLSQVR